MAGSFLIGRFFLRVSTVSTVNAIASTLGLILLICFGMAISRTFFFVVGLTVLGALLYDSTGVAVLGANGAILWLLGGVVAFIVTCSYFARHIAPPFNQDRNTTSFLGLRLLLRHAIREFRVERKPVKHVAPNIPKSFRTVKAGEIPTHEAYAIYNGSKFVRAEGPGYVMLQRKDRIQAVFDVRPYSRTSHFSATTRDGIPVETSVSVNFHVFRSRQEANEASGNAPLDTSSSVDDGIAYPYAKGAIHRLMFANTVQSGGDETTVHPYTQVAPRGMLYVSEHISRRTLKQLLDRTDSRVRDSSRMRDVLISRSQEREPLLLDTLNRLLIRSNDTEDRFVRVLERLRAGTADRSHLSIRTVEQLLERYPLLGRTLNQLFDRHYFSDQLDSRNPLDEIAKIVQQQLQAYFLERGIKIKSVRIAELELPEKVQESRIELWRKSWNKPVDEKGLGSGFKPISADAAASRLEVVNQLIGSLDTLRKAGEDTPIYREIMERVEKVIADAATEGLIDSLLPPPPKGKKDKKEAAK